MSFWCPRGMSQWPRPGFGSAPGGEWPMITWKKLRFSFLFDFSLSSCLRGRGVCFQFLICCFASFVCCCHCCCLLSFPLPSFFIHLWPGHFPASKVLKSDKWENGCKNFLAAHEYLHAPKRNVAPPAQGWRIHLFFYKKWAPVMIRSSHICFTKLSSSPITRHKIK